MNHKTTVLSYTLLSLCAAAFPVTGTAEDAKPHPIDAAQGACLDSAKSTTEMRSCLNNARDSWESEAKKALAELVSSLAPGANGVEVRGALERDLQSWSKFQAKEAAWY